jgi:hypothetical protein
MIKTKCTLGIECEWNGMGDWWIEKENGNDWWKYLGPQKLKYTHLFITTIIFTFYLYKPFKVKSKFATNVCDYFLITSNVLQLFSHWSLRTNHKCQLIANDMMSMMTSSNLDEIYGQQIERTFDQIIEIQLMSQFFTYNCNYFNNLSKFIAWHLG